MSAVEKFPILLSEAEEDSSAVPPCFSHEGINVRDLSCSFPFEGTTSRPSAFHRLRLTWPTPL